MTSYSSLLLYGTVLVYFYDRNNRRKVDDFLTLPYCLLFNRLYGSNIVPVVFARPTGAPPPNVSENVSTSNEIF